MAAENGSGSDIDHDVVVVGAGMAGLYLLYKFRELGFSAVALETADDVGGTWYWNRYPGARCDVMSVDYSYSFDAELEEQWEWSERYATQPEILRYLQHVADKHDLRRDIRFETRVDHAAWDDDAGVWNIHTDGGDVVRCRWYVMATGCLSVPKGGDIDGADAFRGDTYVTGRWPHEGVDFTGKRVGVIGTGSSAIQSIPIMAAQADAMTVFQRTPNFSIPARNGPADADRLAELHADRAAFREQARWSPAGVPLPMPEEGAFMVDEAERERRFELGWQEGTLFGITRSFNDLLTNPASNDLAAEFVRRKIRETVHDPETAEALCPKDFPLGTKRLCLDSNYYETFNEPHVRLVDLRTDPIVRITETGIETESGHHEFDAIVFATGFDAMTGAIVSVDIRGRDGVELRDVWADGPQTYLGLTTVGFPNLFMVTGPQSPSVLSNMAVSIEQHVEWICDTLVDLRDAGHDRIEPTQTAQDGWVQHTADCGNITLFPRAKSWYMGANVPGKTRVFLPYVGGVDRYRQTCFDVREQGYLGFARSGPGGEATNDGVVNRLQPDVAILLDTMAELGLPPIESMSPADARMFMEASSEQRPPGPEVGEMVDGTYPAGDGSELAYRLYRPATPGPHPVVAYFHGGGWVLGHATSDDPLCRELCLKSECVIVSFDYRHAPEAPFPAAVEDGFAAVGWLADHAAELGGDGGPIVVAGWSAGGNVAAVAAQRARDLGGPAIAGQMLITPVVDADFDRASYSENAEGYILTRALMDWFWDHYCPPEQRTDPAASPLRGELAGLPPTVVFTAEFDPLRDEGAAYVEALQAAGSDARLVPCRGQTHTSLGAVDMMISSISIREKMAEALRQLHGAPVPA